MSNLLKRLAVPAVLFLVVLGVRSEAADSWPIVVNGQAKAAIVIPANASAAVHVAAEDLQRYVLLMSGARLPIHEALVDSKPQVFTDTTVILINPAGDGPAESDGSFIVRTERESGRPPTIRITGRGAPGAMYGAYTLLEKLGVKFFHPEEEFIPKTKDLKVGQLNISQSPVYKWRGIQQHTLHPIEYTEILMAHPTDENLQRAYRYVEWLAKNKQNYLFWWWMDTYDIPSRREYVNKIVLYAHDRGIKVGLVVGMPFRQQHSYNLLKCDVCFSETEKWTECLRQGVDEVASLGVDALCVFFGENEFNPFKKADGCTDTASSVKVTVERVEALRTYVKAKYPRMFITLWVHPTMGTAGDETCPRYFFLPKLCSPDVGAAVHTTQFYDLVNPAPTYGNTDFSALKDFAFEQAKVRPVWYWPETAYWCGFDIDTPLYFPLYIKSRWTDAKLLADTAEGHITFSSGLEWMYWLNDYAVAKFGWDPKTFGVNDLLSDYASIFGPKARDTVVSAINDVIEANELYLIQRSKKPGHNLMELVTPLLSNRNIGTFEGKSAADIKVFQAAYLPDLKALADKYERAYTRLKSVEAKIDPQSKPWFDELLDTMQIAHLRCMHQLEAYKAVTKFALEETASADIPVMDDKVVADLLAIQAQAKEIVTRRQTHYRFPSGEGNPFYSYLPTVGEWKPTTDYLSTLTGSESAYVKEGVTRPIRCTRGRLEVVGDVGLTRSVAVKLPDDYPVDKTLRLMVSLSDMDSATEGVMIIAGKEYPLPISGDSNKVSTKLDLPPGTFKPGANEVVFKFNDNVGGSTRGFYVNSMVLAVPK